MKTTILILAVALTLAGAVAAADLGKLAAARAAFGEHTRAFRYHEQAASALVACLERAWRMAACQEHIGRYTEALEWLERAKADVAYYFSEADDTRALGAEYDRYIGERDQARATAARTFSVAKARFPEAAPPWRP